MLQHEVFDRLHRVPQLLNVELNVSRCHVAVTMIQQALGGVIAEPVAESTDYGSKGPSEIMRRELDPTCLGNVSYLTVRIDDSV